MSKFRVMIVKKNGNPVGVRACQVNGEAVVLALKDAGYMKWNEATNKYKIPTIAQWAAILENKDEVNKALKRAGGEPLDGWYWSSSEYSSNTAWYSNLGYSYGLNDINNKSYTYYVRPVLAF